MERKCIEQLEIEFLEYLKVNRGYSSNTIRSYKFDLDRFRVFIEE